MQLYIHDEKHEQVHGALDLGLIPKSVEAKIQEIIQFLDDSGITDRYKRLVLADACELKYEDGEPEVVFHHNEVQID